MAADWQMVSLGEWIDVKHGFAFKGDHIHDEPRGDVLLTPGNFAIGGGFKADKFKYYDGPVPDEFLLREGDLLVTMTDLSKQADTLGYPAFVPACEPGRRYLHNQRLGKVLIKSRQSIDARFLHYLLCSADYRHEVLASATGTTVKHTSPERIVRFCFRLPPLHEQHAIAHILGTLDDKIELNRRMNETLQAMARALFKSWFVDFDPVRAKAEGRDPGLPKPLADLFPARLVDSELGEIPEGWKVGTLARVADAEKGLSYKGAGLAGEGGLPMVNLGCFAGRGLFKAENMRRYSGAYKDRHVVKPGDLVIANTDMTQNRVILGSPALVPELDGERRFLFTHHTFALRFKPGVEIWRKYVYFTLLQPEFREIAEGFATGTTVLALPRDGLLNFTLRFPPEPILVAFENRISPCLESMDTHRRESRTLAALRDALLPKLISGALRVKEAERFLERTA